ncbi:MAG TPA: BatD family protein [Myxococcota bacterium]|nr:BatD family protein [Myxococcota bacterium]
MQRRYIQVISLVLTSILLFTAESLAAGNDVSFSASVDRTTVGLTENVVLTLSVSAKDSVSSSSIKIAGTGTLRITGTSREESLAFSFSGGSQNYEKIQKFIYVLKPTRVGKTRISPATLKFKGKNYATKPIDITVVKQARRRPSAGSTSPFGRRFPSQFGDDWDDFFHTPRDSFPRREKIGPNDIFVRASAGPDVAVEGQQVTVSVSIFSKVGARIATIRWPKLDDFFSVDSDVSKAGTDQKYINGELYQYKVLDRKALFPLSPGEIVVGPIEVEVEASTSPFFPSQVRTLRTQPITIKVLDLPATGRPAGFEPSSVGRFSLSASVDSNSVGLNQPVTYTLILKGSGAIQRVRPPRLPDLPHFKTFDPNVDVKVSNRGRAVSGSKTFEYILVPLTSGELVIPSLTFSYFDPREGQYSTLQTEKEIIKVAASQATGPSAAAGGGHEINILAGAFKPIRYKSSLKSFGRPFYKSSLFVPLLAVPLIVYLLVLAVAFVRARGRTDSARNRMRRAWVRGQRHLKRAGQLAAAGKAAEFYSEIKAVLLDGVEARCGLAARGITVTELTRRMEEIGVPREITEVFTAEAENCDFGRFAPATSRGEQMLESLERVRKIVKRLERERIRPAGEG